MNNLKKLFLIVCIIMYLIPVYGQKDTITADGLYLKYNTPVHQGSGLTALTMERIKNKDLYVGPSNDSDIIRGELDRATKHIGLTYKILSQYIISETFSLKDPPANPIELHITTNNVITSQWIHEDGECILFFKCPGMKTKIDRSITELPKEPFYWIKQALGMGSFLKYPTEEEMEKIKKKITIWTPRKAKKIFNAQYVITYPIENEKSVYMNRYTHKMDLTMIKWGEKLTVSFLVTKNGEMNINKYIKDVEKAFRFKN